MQKLVIDTNVLVSYLISEKGYCFKIVEKILLANKVLHFISTETLEEYIQVFNRTRFAKKYPSFYKKSNLLINDLIKISQIIKPSITTNAIKDESDNRFLEVAFTSNADYLITGNKLHFTFSKFHNTQIVSPKEYWEIYRP